MSSLRPRKIRIGLFLIISMIILIKTEEIIDEYLNTLKSLSASDIKPSSILDILGGKSASDYLSNAKTIKTLLKEKLVELLTKGIENVKNQVDDIASPDIFKNIDTELASFKAASESLDEKKYLNQIMEDLKKIVNLQKENVPEEQKKELVRNINVIENIITIAFEAMEKNNNNPIFSDEKINNDNNNPSTSTLETKPDNKEDNSNIAKEDNRPGADLSIVIIIILAAVIFILLIVLCIFSKRRVKNRDIEYIPQTNEAMIRSSI